MLNFDTNTTYSLNQYPTNGYFQTVDKDRILIEEILKIIFPQKLPYGEILPLSGGKSEDKLYSGKFGEQKFVFRIIAEQNLNSFHKQCAYAEMAAEKQLGPSFIYQNVVKGIFVAVSTSIKTTLDKNIFFNNLFSRIKNEP